MFIGSVQFKTKMGWNFKDTNSMLDHEKDHCCKLNGNESTRGIEKTRRRQRNILRYLYQDHESRPRFMEEEGERKRGVE